MQTFYLIRHGEKIPGSGDPMLSEKGILQATATAAYLKQFPTEIIITSPLKRAFQTAEIIGNSLSIPIITHMDLRERANWGDLPGQSFEDFVKEWNISSRDRFYKHPAGDSADETGKRMRRTLDSLSDTPYRHITVISHGGAIKDFLWYTFTIADLRSTYPQFVNRMEKFWKRERFLNLEGDVTECSVTIVEKDEAGYRIKKIAYNIHIKHL